MIVAQKKTTCLNKSDLLRQHLMQQFFFHIFVENQKDKFKKIKLPKSQKKIKMLSLIGILHIFQQLTSATLSPDMCHVVNERVSMIS